MLRLPAFLLLSLVLLAQDAELEHVRDANLERAANMPNFVADEISKRSIGRFGSTKWRSFDTIEAEITVKGIQLTRHWKRKDGKPISERPAGMVPGAGFGAELVPLFSHDCSTTLEFAGREEDRGRRLLVYRFSAPPDGCFRLQGDGQQRYNPARAGRVLVEESTARIVRFEAESTGFPAGFPWVQRNETVTWDSVKIGDESHWLPVASDFIWRLPTGELDRVTIEYKNYRHFEAATSLSFTGSPNPSPPAPSKSLDGVWRSQGYGNVYIIQGPEMKTFEVTAATCVPGFSATRDTIAIPDAMAAFRTREGELYFVRSGGEDDHKRLHSDGSASDIRIDRLQSVPAVCSHATANTPLDNFEVFSRTWAEHYISFDLKRTDWAKVVAENRPKVTSKTTPAQLFDILVGMIQPFGDAHTGISAPGLKREFETFRPGTDRVLKGGEEKFRADGMRSLLAVTDRYLDGPVRKFCNDQIQYGHIGGNTGYLRIVSFGGYSKEDGFAPGLAALESALDEIFSDAGLQSLVLDLRINFGGDDPYGLAIASRLAASEYLAYTKEARAHPVLHDQWTPGDPSVVRPSSRPGFRGPVVELIGPLTISAGETFTQALMGRTPHVTRVGENTQGVFSDVLGRQLPNGWSFWLPNEVFRTAEGKAFDGPGIPPDESVPVFADDDVAAGRDPGMAKALAILGVTK